MTANGMQGSWTWPTRTSLVRGAVLAALPEDGSPISRGALMTKVRAECADVADGTISAWIHDLAADARSDVVRVGYGVYKRLAA